MIKEMSESNEYLFANPNSAKGWYHGVSVVRSFASACGAQSASSLTATILQIMLMKMTWNNRQHLWDIQKNARRMVEVRQKTHEEWYRYVMVMK